MKPKFKCRPRICLRKSKLEFTQSTKGHFNLKNLSTEKCNSQANFHVIDFNLMLKEFSRSEVEKHNQPDVSFWIIIDGLVYDLTKFAGMHPVFPITFRLLYLLQGWRENLVSLRRKGRNVSHICCFSVYNFKVLISTHCIARKS